MKQGRAVLLSRMPAHEQVGLCHPQPLKQVLWEALGPAEAAGRAGKAKSVTAAEAWEPGAPHTLPRSAKALLCDCGSVPGLCLSFPCWHRDDNPSPAALVQPLLLPGQTVPQPHQGTGSDFWGPLHELHALGSALLPEKNPHGINQNTPGRAET